MYDPSQNMVVHTLYSVVHRKSYLIRMCHKNFSFQFNCVDVGIYLFFPCLFFLTILEIENGGCIPTSNAFTIPLISSHLFPYMTSYYDFNLRNVMCTCHPF